jgi:hypothetical protein
MRSRGVGLRTALRTKGKLAPIFQRLLVLSRTTRLIDRAAHRQLLGHRVCGHAHLCHVTAGADAEVWNDLVVCASVGRILAEIRLQSLDHVDELIARLGA